MVRGEGFPSVRCFGGVLGGGSGAGSPSVGIGGVAGGAPMTGGSGATTCPGTGAPIVAPPLTSRRLSPIMPTNCAQICAHNTISSVPAKMSSPLLARRPQPLAAVRREHGVVGAAVDAQAGARAHQPHRLGARQRRDVVDVLPALTTVAHLFVTRHRVPWHLARDRDLHEVQGVGSDLVIDDGEGAAHGGAETGVACEGSRLTSIRRDGPSRRVAQVRVPPGVARDCGAAPRRAAANGAFPESDAVLLPVDHPQRIILSTNFGLIISDDDGATWQWTCERAETSMASTYAIGAPPQESLYALSPDVGLASSDDVSCGWIRDGGALATTIATDFFPDPTDARHVLAIAPVPADAGIGADVVYESMDGGDTFDATPLYVAPAGDQLVGVEIARSDPRIIYVAIAAPGPHPVLARSDDAGATWSTFDLEPSIGARTARIIAVDPVDANVVYLRVIGAGAELLAISRDGGMTFTTPITLAGGSLSAFARLASGTVLVAGLLPGDGGTTAGVAWRSGDGGVTFDDWTLAPMPRLRALAERDGTLYLAGSNYSDGWALAVSTDEGRTIAAGRALRPGQRGEAVRRGHLPGPVR